jgi:bifunctional non-homologous end joining protein LigD
MIFSAFNSARTGMHSSALNSRSSAGRRRPGNSTGRKERSKLVYAGKLERGFTDTDRKHILEQLEKQRRRNSRLKRRGNIRRRKWVKPPVMVDAEYRAKTGQGLLRHPAFKGIRRDLIE